MKYTVISNLYSHETETKIIRRHKLCVRIIRNIDLSDLNNLNYLNISKILKIERKTLYNYFPEKDDLHIIIALCLLEDIHKIKLEKIKELKQLKLTNKEYVTKLLYTTLDSIVFLKKDSIQFLKQFETYLSYLISKPATYELYLKGIHYFKKKYGILEQELHKLINEEIIIPPFDQSDDDIVFTIIESGYSYQKQLLSEKNLSNADISKYLFQYIQVLVEAYTK